MPPGVGDDRGGERGIAARATSPVVPPRGQAAGVAGDDVVVAGAAADGRLVKVPGRPVGGGRKGDDSARAVEAGPLSRHQRGLGCLWAYTCEHGVARPPAACVTGDGFRLGRWVVARRREHGRDPVRDALLESLPGWTWNTRDQRFEERLRQFLIANSGDLRGDHALRDWAVRQWEAARCRRALGEQARAAGAGGCIEVCICARVS